MSNLPPGVTDSMIPGNTPEDVEWNRMVEELEYEANALVAAARRFVANAKHSFGFGAVETLIADALAEEGVIVG